MTVHSTADVLALNSRLQLRDGDVDDRRVHDVHEQTEHEDDRDEVLVREAGDAGHSTL